MKSSRFSEEQIIGILREHEAGTPTTEICWNQAVIHETGEARDRKGPAPERLLGARLSAWALDLQKMPRMTRWFGPAPQQWEHHRYTPPFANALLQQGQTLAFFSARKTSWSCPGWQRSSMSSSDKSIAGDQCGGRGRPARSKFDHTAPAKAGEVDAVRAFAGRRRRVAVTAASKSPMQAPDIRGLRSLGTTVRRRQNMPRYSTCNNKLSLTGL